MVEIIRLIGELERKRVQKPQASKCRPEIARALNMGDVGDMRQLVESRRWCAQNRGDSEQRENGRCDH